LDKVFLSEAFDYIDHIQRERLEGYVMQAYIVQNPHTKDPKEMIEALQRQINLVAGVSIYEADPNAKPEEGAMQKLKNLINKK
jgi:hypothetical protein